jgi:hypothetical protein
LTLLFPVGNIRIRVKYIKKKKRSRDRFFFCPVLGANSIENSIEASNTAAVLMVNVGSDYRHFAIGEANGNDVGVHANADNAADVGRVVVSRIPRCDMRSDNGVTDGLLVSDHFCYLNLLP